ncbi:4-hydroxy-tetrahydrodipicolinate synthase [soil metagenome]
MKLHGIIPPVVTPMHADESLDLKGLCRHIDWMLYGGSPKPLKVPLVHGIFVLGTTGEFYSLDEGEKQAVTATAISHINGRLPVFVGTGAESTREVLRLTKMAEAEGAKGVSVITPYFIKPSQAELVDHFRRVAESTSLPVVLYNNPATCGGLSIEPDTVAKLSETANIIGIKDSSGDLQNTIEILRRVPSTFGVLMGRDTLIYNALCMGAAGAIPASCNIAPQLCVGIYEAFHKGDHAAAKASQSRLHPVRTALALGTGNGAVKEALTLLGHDVGPNRRPISPLSEEKRSKLKQVLIEAGLMS